MLAAVVVLAMLPVVVVLPGQVVQAAVETELLATMVVIREVLLVLQTRVVAVEVVNTQTTQITLHGLAVPA
jgi:hypothetical protein